VSMRKVIAFTLVGLFIVSGVVGVLSADQEICKGNPGDKLATAGFIQSGETLSGSIDDVGEVDNYTFSAEANDTVIIRLDTTSSGSNPQVLYIKVTPSLINIQIGEPVQFTARAYDNAGNEIADLSFNWSTDVGFIDSSGYFHTTIGSGTTGSSTTGYVRAFYGSVYGEARIKIVSIQDTRRIYEQPYPEHEMSQTSVFASDVSGSISGHIYQDDGVTPIANIQVWAESYCSDTYTHTHTAEDGSYSITVPSGWYYVEARPTPPYIGEYYNNAYNRNAAIPVFVTAPYDTSDIDFILDVGGTISGHVYQEDGFTPIPNMGVIIDGINNGFGGSATTEVDGSYSLALPTGTYNVWAFGNSEYAAEFYDNAYYEYEATPVSVTVPDDTPSIDFILERGGTISGFVYDEAGMPLPGVVVSTDYPISGHISNFRGFRTADDGSYTITGLQPGNYKVQAYTTGYIDEYYDNVYESSEATPVQVTAHSDTPGINFYLDFGGSISGVVKDDSGSPMVGARIDAFGIDIDYYADSCTADDGSYIVAGLRPGSYTVSAEAPGHVPEYYNNVYEHSEATPVLVTVPSNTPNIDFSLEIGGSISGVVTDDSDIPIIGASVHADGYDVGGYSYSQTRTDGSYTITGLRSGNYRVYASASVYIDEYYDNVYDYSEATPVLVVKPNNTSNINFSLELGGSISGVVKDDSGNPIVGAWVDASGIDISGYGDDYTLNDGSYVISGLPSGNYSVSAEATGFIEEYYDNVYDYSEATPVLVNKPNDTPNINFSLELGGSISGVVKDDSGNPIIGAWVDASGIDISGYGDDYTLNDGSYVISGLPSGNYSVSAEATGFIEEYYDNVYDWSDATPVPVVKPNNTPNINFSLEIGGSISGIVKDDSGNPISRASVSASGIDVSGYGYDSTSADGSYTIKGLLSGNYRVRASASAYLIEYYDNVYDYSEATPVSVTAPDETTGIDFALGGAGTISGVVEDDSGNPIAGATVCADGYDVSDYACSQTAGDGSYTIGGLHSDSYIVSAEASGYLTTYYDNVYDWNDATPVIVTAPNDTPNVNFSLIDRYIFDIYPSIVTNSTVAIVHILGLGFTTGMQVELRGAEASNIQAHTVVYSSPTMIVAHFDLSDALLGTYDMAITWPDSYEELIGSAVEVAELQEGALYSFPDININEGDTRIYPIEVPETHNLFITLQKTTLVDYGDSWLSELSLWRGGQKIASASGSHDLILHIVDPEPGSYTINITASQAGSGILTVWTSLPRLPLGEWVVGTIYTSYGSIWYQVEVPPAQDALCFEAEAIGLWSHFDVYHEEYGGPDHRVSPQGTQPSIEIPNPDPGTYIVEFLDSAMLCTDSQYSEDQTRDVLIKADTAFTAEPLPGYLPTITSVSTDRGGNTGFVTVEIKGGWLGANATVSLVRSGYADIVAQYVYGSSDGTALTATFDLTDKEPGEWNLVVTNPDGQSATAPSPFTIEEGGEPELWVEVVGREKIRVGTPQKYIIRYGNRGLVNAEYAEVLLWFPNFLTAELASKPHETDCPPVRYDPNFLPPENESDVSGYMIVVFDVAPGSVDELQLTLTSPFDSVPFEISARMTQDFGPTSSTKISSSTKALEPFSHLPTSSNATSQNNGEDLYDIKIEFLVGWRTGISQFSGEKMDHAILTLPEFDEEGNVVGERSWTQTKQIDGKDILKSGPPEEIKEELLEQQGEYWISKQKGSRSLTKEEIQKLAESLDLFTQQQNAWDHQEQPFKGVSKEGKFVGDCIGILDYCAELAWKNDPRPWMSDGFVRDVDSDKYEGARIREWFDVPSPEWKQDFPQWIIYKIEPGKAHNAVDTLHVEPVTSATPEDKYGPTGFDLPGTPYEERQRFVPADQNLYYKVDFWNAENATAPACDVFVEDQLDANLDWSTFRFEEIGFLDWKVELEPCQYFNVNVDTRPEMDLIVNVEGTFDAETGAINWTFRSLAPNTMETPEDPMAGFLPPITESGREVGWVCFSVYPEAGLPSGTQIGNQAFVNFDGIGPYNPAPKEGPWINTIDSPPYVPGNSLPEHGAAGVPVDADLSWTGGDPDAGDTVTYDVYFGTSSTPPLVSPDQSGTVYDTGTLAYNTKYYWQIVATDNHEASTSGPLLDFTTVVAQIVGETREVNSAIVGNVTVTLYQGAVEITSTVSNSTGNYELEVPALGSYDVAASKDGFQNKTQTISVTNSTTYTLDFVGAYGLIRNAPNMPYVLACINLWKVGTPPYKLNMSTVLAVINAWKIPI
jgi:hypothetical protein